MLTKNIKVAGQLGSEHYENSSIRKPTPSKPSKKNSGQSKVQFLCRVLPALNIAENSELNVTQSSSKSKHFREIIRNPNELCVFSATEESGNIVVASEEPVKTRLIETYFKKDKDLEGLRDSFLSTVETFEFDCAMNFLASQEKLYKSTCKTLVEDVLDGRNSTYLVFGADQSGKSYLIRGEENREKGLLIRAADDILTKIEIEQQQLRKKGHSDRHSDQALYFSCYAIYRDEVIDMLSKSPAAPLQVKEVYEKTYSESKIIGLTRRRIKLISELKSIYNETQRSLQAYGEKNGSSETLRNHSHIIYSLEYETTSQSEFDNIDDIKKSKISFVRLLDFEPDSAYYGARNSDFCTLIRYIHHCSAFQDVRNENKVFRASKLTFCLRETMNEKSRCAFVCVVSPNPSQYSNAYYTLQYCSNIRKELKTSLGYSGASVMESSSSYRPVISSTMTSAEVKSFKTEPEFRDRQDIDPKLSDNISEFAKEIRENLRRVTKLPAIERRNWILEKEYELANIERSLKLYQHSSSPSIFKSYENVLRDLREDMKQTMENDDRSTGLVNTIQQSSSKKRNREILSLGTPNTTRAEPFRKFEFEEIRAPTHSSRNSGIKKSWDSRANQEATEATSLFREKEEKLDKDFIGLMERYNKSKQKIESFCNRTSHNMGKEFFYEQSVDDQAGERRNINVIPYQEENGVGSKPPRYSGPGQERQEILNEYTSLERDINSLKRNILSKIDDAKTNEVLAPNTRAPSSGMRDSAKIYSSLKSTNKGHTRTNSKGNNVKTSYYHQEEDLPARSDAELSSEEPNYSVDDAENNKHKLNKSIKKLKNTIDMKENLERTKVAKLKEKNRDLKTKVKECMSKIEEYESALEMRERLVRNYEADMKGVQAELDRYYDKMQELKNKEEILTRNEEELREANMNLKTKLVEKKRKIEEMRDLHKVKEEELSQVIERQDKDLAKFHSTFEELQETMKNDELRTQELEKENARLEAENAEKNELLCKSEEDINNKTAYITNLQTKLEQEIELRKEASTHSKSLQEKYDEFREQIANLEKKIQRTKAKADEEKLKINEESARALEKKKVKIENLKAEGVEQTEKINLLNEKLFATIGEKQKLETEMQELEQEIEESRTDLENLQKEMRELERHNINLNEERTESAKALKQQQDNLTLANQENEKLKKTVKGLEKKIAQGEEQRDSDKKQFSEVQLEMARLQDDNQKMRDYITKLETQGEFIEKQHNFEIIEIERRCQALETEARVLKDENTDIRKRETDFKKAAATHEEAANGFKEKYLKMKFENKSLRTHLHEVEERVRIYATERTLEAKEQMTNKENAQKVLNNKVKMLEEIQYMIKNHRTHSRKSEYDN